MSGVDFFDRACEMQNKVLSQLKEGIMKLHCSLVDTINERDKMVEAFAQLSREKDDLTERIIKQAREIKLLRSKGTLSPCQIRESEEMLENMTPQTAIACPSAVETDTLDLIPAENNAKVKEEETAYEIHITDNKLRQDTEEAQDQTTEDPLPSISGEEPTNSSIHVHQCKQCPASFTYSFELKAHMARHQSEKPFKCEYCGAGFLSSSNRNQHRIVHTNEKRHQCELCSKRFKHYRALRQHYRIHTGEKPFQCPHCSSRFSQSGHLQSHLRIHVRDKRVRCTHCSGTFFSSTNLLRHMRSHHADVLYLQDAGSETQKDLDSQETSISSDISTFGEVIVVPLSS